MSKTRALRISDDLSLPADAVTSTIVVYGGKGTGKTNLASVLAEEFSSSGLRFAIMDPMGVLWGLRHSADGRGAGIEVLILGGIHGDLPIEPTSGAVVADLVADESVSVIIDISRRPDGSMWSIAERTRFVTAFAKRLYQRQGERRRPLNLIIDEAARFAPQIVRHGDSDVAACIGAIAVIVEEGRNVGIGVTLVTQRSARLNKDVAELADCMIAFRIVGPNSMRAVLDWLGEHVDKARLKDIGEKLRSLPRGSALVVSPGWLDFEGIVEIRKRRTFDSSKTPEAGKEVRASGKGAMPDLGKYRERMAEVVEQQQANDPKTLKATIAELRKQLARGASKMSEPRTVTIEKPVLNKAAVIAMERSIERGGKTVAGAAQLADRAGAMMQKAAEMMSAAAITMNESVAKLTAALANTQTQPRPQPSQLQQKPRPVASRPAPATRDASEIGAGGLRRIMIALAQRNGLDNRRLGLRAGLSSRSGTFSTYLSRARGQGWIVDDGDLRNITAVGIAALGHYDPLPTGRALADHWLRELGESGAARILRVLIDAHPSTLDAATIGERAGLSPRSGTYSTYVSRLRGLELITGRQTLGASEELIGE